MAAPIPQALAASKREVRRVSWLTLNSDAECFAIQEEVSADYVCISEEVLDPAAIKHVCEFCVIKKSIKVFC